MKVKLQNKLRRKQALEMNKSPMSKFNVFIPNDCRMTEPKCKKFINVGTGDEENCQKELDCVF